MSKTTCYQRNNVMILNRAKEYYQNKDRLREQERDKCRQLSDEENNMKREYGKNIYQNMSEENKQKLKEYQRSYREAKRSR